MAHNGILVLRNINVPQFWFVSRRRLILAPEQTMERCGHDYYADSEAGGCRPSRDRLIVSCQKDSESIDQNFLYV